MSAFRFAFLSDDERYCVVHYDFVLRKVVNLHTNVNMDLPREEDYKLVCKFHSLHLLFVICHISITAKFQNSFQQSKH